MQVGSGTEIKFLAAGREHSHIVTSDMTGKLRTRHQFFPMRSLISSYRSNTSILVWKQYVWPVRNW